MKAIWEGDLCLQGSWRSGPTTWVAGLPTRRAQGGIQNRLLLTHPGTAFGPGAGPFPQGGRAGETPPPGGG